MSMETLQIERQGAVFHIWLNRPEARNAFNELMDREFAEALAEARDDEEIRVVTLRGRGPCFSSGHDLKEAAAHYAKGLSPGMAPGRIPALDPLWYFPKPLIAAVHGFVGPWSFLQLGYVDFVLAEEGTRFSMEQARLGAEPPAGTPLIFNFPMKAWKKLMMMGGWMDAERALHYDFVQAVVPEGGLGAELDRWTDYLSRITPKQIASTKTAIHRQYELMGLAEMELVRNRVMEGGHGTPEDMEWFASLDKVGLREALRARDEGIDPEVPRL